MSKVFEKAGTARFTVTVEKDAFDTLERYCYFMGITKSHMINSWLIESTDSLNALLDIAEKAKKGEVDEKRLNEKLEELKALLNKAGDL